MEIEIEITRDELYRAVKAMGVSSFRQFRATGTYKVIAGLSIATVIGLGASAMTLMYRSADFDYFSFLLMIFLFVCYTVIFRLVTSEFNRFVVYNSKRYIGPVRLKLDDEYLYVRDASITSRFRYGSFCKVEDTKDLLLLYIDIHQAVIIPKKDDRTKEFAAVLLGRAKPAVSMPDTSARLA